MAYAPRLEIRASLTRNNTRDDTIDNLLYEEMADRIREITEEARYAGLHPDIVTTGIDWLPDDPDACRSCSRRHT